MKKNNIMKTENIFKKEVSWFDSIYENEPSANLSLGEILFDRTRLTKTLVEEYQKMVELEEIEGYPDDESKQLKKQLPCFTPSGIFNSRKNSGLTEHSGVVCIDIDAKDNLDVANFYEIRQLMRHIPYVAYCSHSCSGEGYFVLIPIAQPEKHREHFISICDDFERCKISVDRACINVSRTRTVSFDENAYINENTTVYTRLKDASYVASLSAKSTPANITDNRQRYLIAKRKKMTNENWIEDPINLCKLKDIISWVNKNKIDLTETEQQWYQIGVALADGFGEYGRGFYHEVSRYYPKYSKQETNNKFDHCLTSFGYKIGTFFHLAKEYGFDQ